MKLFSLAFSTFILRPYVLAFFILFVIGSCRVFGWRRAFLYFIYTYALAFTLEVCSTQLGFPFGMYVYHVSNTADKELWVLGIPWMSTLSFVFLSFFSYRVAVYFFPRAPWSWPFWTALFMFLVDFVIDPVTLRGQRWFLGDLYHYPEPGLYFGVPFVNFLGWALAGFFTSLPFALEEWRKKREAALHPKLWRWDYFLSWVYIGAIFFMTAVAFWMGEDRLGIIGVSVGALLGLFISFRRKYLRSSRAGLKPAPTVVRKR